MPSPTIGQTYTSKIVNISGTGKPMVQKKDWDDPVIVLSSHTDDFSIGDQIEFIVKQKLENHYQARLPDRQSSVSSPTFNRIYRGEIFENTTEENPVIQHANWDLPVVIITEESNTFSKGDTVQFVVKKRAGKEYQALLSHKAPAVKPHYGSKPVIPIHHDGKDNESVGDTRPDEHATKPVDERY